MPETRRLAGFSAVPAVDGGCSAAAAAAAATAGGGGAAAAGLDAVAGLPAAGAARMLVEQRTDLPPPGAALVVACAPRGVVVPALLAVGTLGCVAVRGLPNARAAG